MGLRTSAISKFGVLLMGVGLVGCGSMGTLRGALPDTSFVQEAWSIQYRDAWGTRRIRLDGTGRVDLFPAKYAIQDALPGDRFALWDSNTDLFVSLGLEAPREVPELRGRTSEVRFSNDGTKLAVSRHADYSLPQSDWVEDDAIYVIDAASLAVTVYPARSDEWVTSLGWNDDGTEVWTESQNGVRQWLNLATGLRRDRAEDDRPNPRGAPGYGTPSTCAATGDNLTSNDQGISLVHPDGTVEPLVHLDGRKRGYEDFEPSFDPVFFSPSCAHVVFGWGGSVWVAKVATQQVGKLTDGRGAMPIP